MCISQVLTNDIRKTGYIARSKARSESSARGRECAPSCQATGSLFLSHTYSTYRRYCYREVTSSNAYAMSSNSVARPAWQVGGQRIVTNIISIQKNQDAMDKVRL